MNNSKTRFLKLILNNSFLHKLQYNTATDHIHRLLTQDRSSLYPYIFTLPRPHKLTLSYFHSCNAASFSFHLHKIAHDCVYYIHLRKTAISTSTSARPPFRLFRQFLLKGFRLFHNFFLKDFDFFTISS